MRGTLVVLDAAADAPSARAARIPAVGLGLALLAFASLVAARRP